MKDMLGVKEEDEKQNQREKTAFVIPNFLTRLQLTYR